MVHVYNITHTVEDHFNSVLVCHLDHSPIVMNHSPTWKYTASVSWHVHTCEHGIDMEWTGNGQS